MAELLTTSRAWELILEQINAAPVIGCPLFKAAGRVLREPVVADRPFPPFDRVMMDGIAVRYGEGVRSFVNAGTQSAGRLAPIIEWSVDTAVETATGAPLPVGADTVIPCEWLQQSENRYTLMPGRTVKHGQYVHPVGSDCAAGSILLKAGVVLGPREIAVAAACGYAELNVSQLPRIAVLTTGDEIVPVGEILSPDKIRGSNGPALETALALGGTPCKTIQHAGDSEDALRETILGLLNTHDCLIVTGGVGTGARDYVLPALLACGAQLVFHGVAQKPGKPMAFLVHGKTLIFALPGNPVSSLVCYFRFVKPALAHRAGNTSTPSLVTLSEALPSTPLLAQYLPVQWEGAGAVRLQPFQNSGDMIRVLDSAGFIEIPPSPSGHAAGGVFSYYPW